MAEKSLSQFLLEAEYDAVHSSFADIKKFSKAKIGSRIDQGWLGRGFYFIPRKLIDDEVTKYGPDINHFYGSNPTGGINYIVVLTMNKPFVSNNIKGEGRKAPWHKLKGWKYGKFPLAVREDEIVQMRMKGLPRPDNKWETQRLKELATQFTQALKDAGYDSVIDKFDNVPFEYLVFEPSQIKFKFQPPKGLSQADFDNYLKSLTKSLGKNTFDSIFNSLKTDKRLTVPDAKKLAKAFTGKPGRSKSDSLNLIYHRHASLKGAANRTNAIGKRIAG